MDHVLIPLVEDISDSDNALSGLLDQCSPKYGSRPQVSPEISVGSPYAYSFGKIMKKYF